MVAQVAAELVGVEPDLRRVPDDVADLKRALVVHQHVVHLPELALDGRRLGGLGGQLRVRVDLGERQVPEDETQLAVLADHPADGGLCLPAVRALEVTVLDEGDEGVLLRAADVVALRVDRHRQVGDRGCRAEQRPQPCPRREAVEAAEDQPGEQRRADRAGQDAQLGLGELRAAERQRGDEQRDGEPDPGDRARARDRAPADGRRQALLRDPADQPGRARRADRLADEVADHDAECGGGGVGVREERAADLDVRVGQREQRDDHVARQFVVALLQLLVRRDGAAHHVAGLGREPGGWLLAEQAEGVGGLLEVLTRGRVSAGQQADDEAGDDRVDA